MGKQTILFLIFGITMSITIGAQLVPNVFSGIKDKQVITTTNNNQEVLFASIVSYIEQKQVPPSEIKVLIDNGFLNEEYNDNGFDGKYEIDSSEFENKGIIKIRTEIKDEDVRKKFISSFEIKNLPTCSGNICTTTFVVPTRVKHSNGMFIHGVPIQNLEPNPSEHKYWYDTSSGKAVLKISNGTTWMIVENIG